MPDYGHSLMLDAGTWDLTLDEGGNVAQCTGDYAAAQEVSTRIRLFTDDAYYEPEQGIPHFAVDLGQRASEALVRSRYRGAALAVPGVTDATVSGISVEDRTLHGTVEITLQDGVTADVVI